MSGQIAFSEILKRARLNEAAHFDALAQVKDARSLRLQSLRATLVPQLQNHAEAQDYLELAMQPGEIPRLWIDLITSVVVEPDTRNFRLQQEQDGTRSTVYETENIDEMAAQVLRFIAHRVIAKQRASIRLVGGKPVRDSGYSLGAMIYVWFTGVALGVLTLLVAAIALKILNF